MPECYHWRLQMTSAVHRAREKLKLGKQKAEIQRQSLAIPPFLISAFCFPNFYFSPYFSFSPPT